MAKLIKILPKPTRQKISSIKKINKKINKLNARTKLNQARTSARQASLEARLQSRNPIVRKMAEHEQIVKAKQESRLRTLEAKTQNKELKPTITKKQLDTDAQIKVAKAKARAKFAGYAALAKGASTLGKGLSDENNQDDAAERKHQMDMIKTIMDDSESESESGLKQGVI